jgi:hypothetical protein
LPLYARFGIRCTGSIGVAKFMRNHAMRILRVTGDIVDDNPSDKRAAQQMPAAKAEQRF